MTAIAGPALRSASTMPSSDSVNSPVGSNSIRVTSTSFRLAAAVWVMRESSRLRGLWMPGVSSSTYCTGPLVIMPVIRLRVVCAFWVTMATFSPTRWLVRLDLPTLGRPTRATNTLEGISGSLWFFCIRTFSFNLLQSAGYLARLGSPVLHGWAAGPYFSSVLFSFGVLTCSCLPRRKVNR